MFDGICEVVLPVADLDGPVRLYRDLMGFTVTRDVTHSPASSELAALWDLPTGITREVQLSKPGSSGGSLRLVEAPGLPAPTPAGRPDRPGPYALDFYLRDAARVEARLEEAGQEFVTEAVHYSLPGTEIPVRERMLVVPHAGLLHACVQYRPRGTRCVLDQVEREDTSEVVAVVFLTEAFEDARRFARDVLGGHEYYAGRFDGPAVEAMLSLSPGEGFAAALYRGPTSANARLEFGEAITPSDRRRDPVHRVIVRVEVDDLEALSAQLADGSHGRTTARLDVDGRERLGLVSRYGAVFDFTERVPCRSDA